MSHDLMSTTKVTRVFNGSAAGTGTISTSILDMAGFDGVVFLAEIGDAVSASVLTMTAQQNTSNATGGMATLAGSVTYTPTTATAADDNMLVLEVHKPRERYVRAQLDLSAHSAAVEGIVALQYGAAVAPVTQGTDVLDSDILLSPAEN